MRSSAPPFWYVSTSNMPSASAGERTSNSTVRVLVERVDLEGAAALHAERGPALPVGAVRLARGDLHERGERLVEPDAVPPAHRHEVAEPHVGEFVGDDVGDELLLVLGAGGRIDEHHVLAERDAAEVLHGAGREVGECDEIDLVARIGDAVVLLEPAQAEGADIERRSR